MGTGVQASPFDDFHDASLTIHSSPTRHSNTNEPAPNEYVGGTGTHHDVDFPKCRATTARVLTPGDKHEPMSTKSYRALRGSLRTGPRATSVPFTKRM